MQKKKIILELSVQAKMRIIMTCEQNFNVSMSRMRDSTNHNYLPVAFALHLTPSLTCEKSSSIICYY